MPERTTPPRRVSASPIRSSDLEGISASFPEQRRYGDNHGFNACLQAIADELKQLQGEIENEPQVEAGVHTALESVRNMEWA